MNNFNVEKLPEGWEVKSLADIGNIFSGNSINAKLKEEKYTNREGTPYVATKDISYNSVINYDNGINIPFDDVNKFRLAKSETLLICAEGGSAGRKVGILNQDVYFVNKLFALETISEVNSKFCFYWYLSKEFKSNFKDKLKGLIGGVSKTDFKNLPIPIPPLQEQKRIVAKIDTLFAKIDKAISLTEESLKQAKNLLPSVLKEVFETMDGVEKFLPDLAKEGRYSIKRGPFGSSLKKQFFVPSGYKVYEQKHAIKNDFEIGEYFVNEEKYLELKAFELKPRDIIISCSGTIGKIAVAPHNIIPGIINQALLKISLNEDEIEIPFFTYWFNNYVNNGSLSTKGAAIKNIVSVKELKTIPIKVPNLNKQKEICDKLDRYLQLSNQTQSKLEGQLAYLKQLKSSILSKAFKGEL